MGSSALQRCSRTLWRAVAVPAVAAGAFAAAGGSPVAAQVPGSEDVRAGAPSEAAVAAPADPVAVAAATERYDTPVAAPGDPGVSAGAGCEDGSGFCPGRDITTAQMAKFPWCPIIPLPMGAPACPLPFDVAVDAVAVSNDSPMADQTLTLEATVRNRGWRTSPETTLRWYRSTDSTVTAADVEVGADKVPALRPSASGAESVQVWAPSAPGTYYYGACADSAYGDSATANDCSDAVAVAVSAFRTEDLAWVADGVTGNEPELLRSIEALGRVDRALAQRLAGSLWLADGATRDEMRTAYLLALLADDYPEVAVLAATVPPDSTGNLLGALLHRVVDSAAGDLPTLSEQLLGQAWYRDGLTEEEAALAVVVGHLASFHPLDGMDDLLEDLLRGGQVRSATISAPLAGEVDLFVVGSTQDGLDEVLEILAYGVPVQEGYLGVPWPNPDVIALLDLDPQRASTNALGLHSSTHITLRATAEGLVWHELAHHYFNDDPAWLREGAANFLALYTAEQERPGALRAGHIRSRTYIGEACAPHGAGDVLGFIDAFGTQAELDILCAYYLGQVLLTELYSHVGREVVSSALGDLHETDATTERTLTEDEVFEAFLNNTPSSKQETLRSCYHRIHGRPIPGLTAAAGAAPTPGIRDALAALYNATGGPDWKNNDNWLTTAPLGGWHGVLTGCDGSMFGLSLSQNELSGPIPPELGGLSNLAYLGLEGNRLSGPIPPELAGLSNLGVLNLSWNQLSGTIPPELGGLSNLVTLGLDGNELSGPIPPELGGLSNLESLLLSWNRLSGPIPPELAGLSNLELLWLGGNRLSGQIPPELGGLSDLHQLLLDGNRLSGPIPAELGGLSNLKTLWLAGNGLTGCVPGALAAVADNDLYDLDLNSCEDS